MRLEVRFCVVATLVLFVLASTQSTSSHSGAVVKPLRILVLFPHFGKSHYDVFEHLFKTLAERGHHITAVTHFPQNPPVKNYRQILIDQPELPKSHAFDIGIFTRSFLSKFAEPVLLSYLSGLTCDTLGQPEIQALLRKPKNSFDLIIVEAFNTDCYLGFVHHFGNVPFIAVSSSAILPWYNERFGNSENPAFVNNIIMGYWNRMSFHERVENSVAYLAHNIFYRQTHRWITDVAVRKYFHNDAMPPTEDIALNCSLILVNSHHSLQGAQAISPRMVEVGGIHVGKNLMKKLPEVSVNDYITLLFQ